MFLVYVGGVDGVVFEGFFCFLERVILQDLRGNVYACRVFV